MMELFTKQGVSIPITTMMVWEAYRHVKQVGEAAGSDGMEWAYLHRHTANYCTGCGHALHQVVIFPRVSRQSAFPKRMVVKQC